MTTTNNNNNHARPPTPKQLQGIIHLLQTTGNATIRLIALNMIYHVLSLDRDDLIKAIVDSGVLVTLKIFLPFGEQPQLLSGTLWVLISIASSSYTAAVVQAGALPGIVNCLWHDDANVREQAIRCVGIVARRSVQFRDEALKLGALRGVIDNINDPNHESLYNKAVWTFANLLRVKPYEQFVEEAFPCLANILANPRSNESLGVSIWAMSYALDGGHERITALLQDRPHVVNVLVNLLEDVEPPHLRPLVRCLANICAGTEDQAQLVKDFQEVWFWIMSIISAGSQDQIASIFSSQAGLSWIVKLAKEAEWGIRKWAVRVLIKIFIGGSDVQIDELVRLGGMEAICSVQEVNDVEILKKVMRALESILAAGERLGTRYKIAMEECQGLTKLKALREHSNDDIYRHAVKIVDEYFGAIDEN